MKKIKIVMSLNALSCLLFGLIFSIFSNETTQYLSGSAENSFVFLIIGIGLIFNGLHLCLSIYRGPRKIELIYFSVGDFLWVIATLAAIGFKFMILTTGGIAAACVIGLMVGVFGTLQLINVKSLMH